MIAIGSPLTKALGMAGRVRSHWLDCAPGAFAPGVRSQSAATGVAPGAAAGAAGAGAAGRAAASLAWAALRCALRRSSSACWEPNTRCASVRLATAASWLDCASAAALSAFAFASRAADSRLTCSVRARCRSAITCWELMAIAWPAAAVRRASAGSAAVR